MNYYLVLFFVILCQDQSFESRLNSICRNFQDQPTDKALCEQLQNDAEELVEEIDLEIKNETNPQIISTYNKLKDEANAVVDFIGAVGNCSQTILSQDRLRLVGKRINYRLSKVGKEEFCVNLISISIGSYTCFLFENNSANNYVIQFQWKTQDGRESGNGKMGLPSHSVRPVRDNRESLRIPRPTVVTCRMF